MTYGALVKRADDTVLLDQSIPGGNIFVAKYYREYNDGLGTTTYTYPAISSHTYLKVYQAQAGPFTYSISTINNQATLTITPITVLTLQSFGGYTLLVFATKVESTVPGLSFTNDSGETIASTEYPCAEFLGKIIPDSNGVWSGNTYDNGTIREYRHSWSTTLGSDRLRMILWTLPDTSVDCYIGTGDSGGPLSLLQPMYNAGSVRYFCPPNTSYSIGEGFVFALDKLTPSTDAVGVRIYDNSTPQKILFDSGLNHMVLKTIDTSIGFNVSTLGSINSYTLNSYTGITPAVFIPEFKAWVFEYPAGMRNFRIYEGAIRRSGNTIYTRTYNRIYITDYNLGTQAFPDEIYYLGNYTNLVQPVIDIAKYNGIVNPPLGGIVTRDSGIYDACSYNAAYYSTCNTSEVFSVSYTNGNKSAVTYTWSAVGGSASSFSLSSSTGNTTTISLNAAGSNAGTTYTTTLRCVISQVGSISVTIDSAISHTHIGQVIPPEYSLSSNLASVNEGGSVTFTVGTANVPNGTLLPYTITGVTSADIGGASLTGNFTAITGTTLTLFLASDVLTEGNETLTITLNGTSTSASVLIYDTSKAPEYYITSNVDYVNEGGSITFTLSTANVPSGTAVAYTIGTTVGIITSADIGGVSLTGTFTAITGTTLTLNISADMLTEGTEAISVTLSPNGASKYVYIYDTSMTETYSVTPSITTVNEGSSVVFTISTTNIDAGTALYWFVGGGTANSSDFNASSGSFTITGSYSSGSGTVTVTPTADALTEGDQTFRLYITRVQFGVSVAYSELITISDTSQTPPAFDFTLSPASWSANATGTLSRKFTINTTNGTLSTYSPSLTGASQFSIQEYGPGSASGPTVVFQPGASASGTYTGTLSVLVNGTTTHTAALSINYTIPPTYTLASSVESVNEGTAIRFHANTTNVLNGTRVYWSYNSFSGTTLADLNFSSGSFLISSNYGYVDITPVSDSTTEPGIETFSIGISQYNGGPYVAVSNVVTINDTSQTLTATLTLSDATTSCTYTEPTAYCTTLETWNATPFGGNGNTISYLWSLPGTDPTYFGLNATTNSQVIIYASNVGAYTGTTYTGTIRCTISQTGSTTIVLDRGISHTHTAYPAVVPLNGTISLTTETASCSYYVNMATSCNTSTSLSIAPTGGDGTAITYNWFTTSPGYMVYGASDMSYAIFRGTGTVPNYPDYSSITISGSLKCTMTQSGVSVTKSYLQQTDYIALAPVATVQNPMSYQNATFPGVNNGATTLTLYSDGTANILTSDGQNFPSSWATPTTAGLGSSYYVRFTRTYISQSATGNSVAASTDWLSLASGASVSVQHTGVTYGYAIGTYTVEISNGQWLVSSTAGISLEVNTL